MISEGKIYKITCGLNNDVYVGSTFDELRYRWRIHKCKYKRWLRDNTIHKCSIFDNFKVLL